MKFKPNEGKLDRAIRAILAVIIAGAGYFYLSGTLQIISYVIGVILLGTAIVGFCGLYTVFGINTTCEVKHKK